MPVFTIAGLTLREAARRKLLLSVGIITLILIPVVGWGFSKIPELCASRHHLTGCARPVEAGMLILVAYMFSLIIVVAAPFLAAPAIATDVESHVILGILPRPLRRYDVVIGRWLGLALLLVLYTGLTCGLEFVAINMSVGYVVPHPILTTLCIMGEAISLMTLALLGSTRLAPITCGIICVVLFGITWIAGIAGQIGAAFGNTGIADIGTVASMLLPTDGFWRAAIFNMEPVSFLAVSGTSREASANPFAVTAPPTTAYVIWALCWIGLALGAAVWSFSRREV